MNDVDDGDRIFGAKSASEQHRRSMARHAPSAAAASRASGSSSSSVPFRSGFTDGPDSQPLARDHPQAFGEGGRSEEEEWHEVILPQHLCDCIMAGGTPDEDHMERLINVLRAQLVVLQKDTEEEIDWD